MNAAIEKASIMSKPRIASLVAGWRQRQQVCKRKQLSLPKSGCPFLQFLPKGNTKDGASGFSILVDQ